MITGDAEVLAQQRRRLSEVSWWMRCTAEVIARRANNEDECTGRFFEGRYRAQLLLDEAGLMACAAYVDLNPIRAALAETPEESESTGAMDRTDDLVSKFGKLFKRAAGTAEHLQSEATRRGQGWLQAPGNPLTSPPERPTDVADILPLVCSSAIVCTSHFSSASTMVSSSLIASRQRSVSPESASRSI